MFDASIIDPIEARLEHLLGPRSRVTVAALLTAIVRNAEQGRPYTRTAVAETLNSFTGDELVALGVLSADQTQEPFSYASVTKRMRALEHALSEGWTADGVEYGLDWFARAMISASVLVGIELAAHARAVDSTAFPASAGLREIAVDRGYTSQTSVDRVYNSQEMMVAMDYDANSAAAETPQSDSGLPRGNAAAQIAATAAAVAHNRRTAAQQDGNDSATS